MGDSKLRAKIGTLCTDGPPLFLRGRGRVAA
jgi:hypothetical protein